MEDGETSRIFITGYIESLESSLRKLENIYLHKSPFIRVYVLADIV